MAYQRSFRLGVLVLAGACSAGTSDSPPLTIALSAQAIDATRVEGVSVELRFNAPTNVGPSQRTVTVNGFSMTLTAGDPDRDGLLNFRIDIAGNPFATSSTF